MRESPKVDPVWLFVVCAARVGSAAPFQAYAGALPFLQTEWDMSGTEAGGLAFAWQASFAASLVILSWLSDRLDPRVLFLWSAWATAIAAALIPLLARDYYSGLTLFSLLALVNGGTYTPGLILLASRFSPSTRGRAIGWFLGSASLGYALGLLLLGLLARAVGWRTGLYAIAGLAAVTAALASAVLRRDVRLVPATSTTRSPGLIQGFFKNRSAVLISLGYTFHAWELLGMWSWTPAFLTAALLTRENAADPIGFGTALASSFHLMGLMASGAAGWLSDRWGRTAVILSMAVVSAICSFSFGWMIALPLPLVLAVGLTYSFSAIGDSAVFSTGFTELVEPRLLGASFAVRSLAGFGAGAIASWAFGVILDLTNPGSAPGQHSVWGWAFSILGVGALLAIATTVWLRMLPASRRMADGKR